jgi:UDP-N-acetylmuramoyl-tripeptide--D-alanyl-D-alanine ligase
MMDTAAAARAVAGRMIGENVRFARVITDTRIVAPGDLFVALKGERFDGHDFVATAFARGAVAAIVTEPRAASLAGNLIAVPDALAALGRLAADWRARFAIPVIVVVGSNGKTTVKEMIASILRAHYGEAAVLATRGNLNNAIGLPLTLLGLRDGHRVAAIELGMNHPGETAELAAIAQPTVAVVNNAQREHQEFMKSVADVAAEHAALVRALPPGGIAVVNADDPSVDVWRAAAFDRPGVSTIEFALDHATAVHGRHVAAPTGATLELTTPEGGVTVRLAVVGRHNAANALAATAAAHAVGVPLASIVRGLEAFRPVRGRLVACVAVNGASVIDDSYNANPDSVRAAIDVLRAAPGPKWLVLGDMGEVGSEGPAFHREIGACARDAGIDRLLTVGTLAAESAAAFGRGGEHHGTMEGLLARLAAEFAAPGSSVATVLVKGSRFMAMERVVAVLCGSAGAEGAH